MVKSPPPGPLSTILRPHWIQGTNSAEVGRIGQRGRVREYSSMEEVPHYPKYIRAVVEIAVSSKTIWYLTVPDVSELVRQSSCRRTLSPELHEALA